MKKIMFLFLLLTTLQENSIKGMQEKEEPCLESIANQLSILLYGAVFFKENKQNLRSNLLEAMRLISSNSLLIDIPLDFFGRTVMHFAAEYSDELLNLLLKYYHNRELIDAHGDTLLHKASRSGNQRCINLLIHYGVHLNKKNRIGFTPLHYAMIAENKNVLSDLLSFGADPDEADKQGNTPLHYAVIASMGVYVRLLLQHDASPFICNQFNKTAIDILVEKYQNQLIRRDAYKLHTSGNLPFHLIDQVDKFRNKFIQDMERSKECCALLSRVDISGRCKNLLEVRHTNFEVTRRVAPNNLCEK